MGKRCGKLVKTLFYYPHCPLPARSGADHRAIQVIRGLVARGDQVTFVSSDIHTESAWNKNAASRLFNFGVRDVKIYRAGVLDRSYLMARLTLRRVSRREDPFARAILVPPGLIYWFEKLVARRKPSRIIVSYCWFSDLIRRCGQDTIAICDNHGLFSINHAAEHWIKRQIERLHRGESVEDRFWSLNLMSDLKIAVDHRELHLYSRFHRVVTLSPTERDLLSSSMLGFQVDYLPLTCASSTPASRGDEKEPICVVGPNQFNRHGLEVFGEKILPAIRSMDKNFQLDVVGQAAMDCRRFDAMRCHGFVEDLDGMYDQAAFAICTTSAGTGQQVKIIEAMSRQMAMIVPRAAAQGTLAIHEETSLVANSHEEFAEQVLRLSQDIRLRKRLGTQAGDAVASQWKKYGDFSALNIF